jgi:3-hydroxyacyl-CoA dehydrogenase
MNSSDSMDTVGIVGAGLVGSGWSIVFALAGFQVRIFDRDPGVRDDVLRSAASAMREMASVGLATDIDAALGRLTICNSLEEAVRDSDYIQESVFERIDVKTQIAQQIGDALKPGAIVGSSSSGIPASAFTAQAPHRERFLVVHPINPPHIVPVVELVPAPWTAKDAVSTARHLVERAGKIPVVLTREIEGFLLNRLQGALLNEAFALLEDGYATAADIDATVSYGLGLRWSFMGPFETIDLNAPGGLSDYAQRLEPLYHSIARSRREPRGWSPELIERANRERREALSEQNLPARREWRDSMLMDLVSHLARRRTPPQS